MRQTTSHALASAPQDIGCLIVALGTADAATGLLGGKAGLVVGVWAPRSMAGQSAQRQKKKRNLLTNLHNGLTMNLE